MRSFAFASAAAALASSAAAADLPSIVIKGSKFFYENNGTQFFMRGVAYQQDYSGNGTTSSDQTYRDPLSDASACKRDIPYLQELYTNTIRVYAINPDEDHDECMTALADAGIYVVADLSAPVDGSSINRNDPQWNDALYERYTSVVDVMAKYTNTLGFFAGNEVSNQANNTDASAFVKAAVRDTKAYIKAQNYRTIGVGYATNDDADIRVDMEEYFNCGDADSAIDFWGYNIYSWCGESSYTKSGYDVRTKEFSSYSVPVFFAEYGCNEVQPRPFTEVGALYGDEMTPVWSGGIVYMYFQEANDYGLVTVDGNNVDTNQDFDNLKSELAKISPSGVNSADYSPTNTAAACPSQGSSWNAKASPLPPSPNKELCNCMYNSLACVVTSQTDTDDYGDLFGTVCGYGDDVCAGLAANASTGTYGAYSMCNSTEQLAFAFNQYYLSQNSAADACDFKGAATLKSATSASGSCETLISEAGTAGTGVVTSSPTANSNQQGSSGGSGSTSSGAAAPLGVPTAGASLLPMAFIVALGMISGAGMILL
ncbi:Putative glucanosyltransferase, X8 domain, glycoside hydrolase superfamily [Septoria linicola]|uniref:1,3-beta-glucanosyltransferase n=1 Tax=Septoria linicola TaxID=215465 RepID=A0A9Q9EQX9_9PEZI|nr:putative glucanosyltransferase, X8 domain, glycoside hydrolase superfamily [Septoria linicola]USW59297.1 Putative glucanosyltransferase, X8 domain, glycoside hydrolase superfamily [Septoria linicola]